MSEKLFTPRFLVMCGYSFTVFVSVFQLLPTAPYHIIEQLGGTTGAAGMFLGALTFASALSAPLTGPLADRLGHRRVLVVVSLILSLFSTSYAFITNITFLLVVVFVHGLFWSALLSASSAYMTATIPADRRAQGLGYWGLMSVTAIAVAPTLGFVMYHHGWSTLCFELAGLNLTMAIIATQLPDDTVGTAADTMEARVFRPGLAGGSQDPPLQRPRGVEWNILALSICLGLVAFGYGGLTSFSALFADAEHISPRSAYLSVMAVTILVSRLGFGHRMDRIGHRRVLLPCLALTSVGLGLLAVAQGIVGFSISAMAFGAGFGLMYPAFAAYVMEHVDARRRGAAFGAIISAFDTGIGMGSTSIGWIVRHSSYRMAFAVAAGLAALALPYFVITEKRLGFHDVRKGRE